MDKPLSVLIIGAGPTGLLMACELARYGISFRILDKKSEPTQTTNAAVIHTRTLELLDHLGIIDRFLTLGRRLTVFRVHGKQQDLIHIPFNHLDSYYKFSLLLPQSETERILNEHLNEFNVQVERACELVDVQQEDQRVISTIKHVNEQEERIESDWLIGCDGIHSLVRDACHIPFSGKELSQKFCVADLCLDTQLSKEGADGYLGKKILAIFPLREDIYRVVLNVEDEEETGNLFTQEELKEMIRERSHGEVRMKAMLRSSPFWIHSRTAESMRKGSIFIAGDAAHVHSPAGGQGMNIGMQDADNLAWKLALVIQGHASSSLLDSYQAERHPVIVEIVNKTERLTKLISIKNRLGIILRDFLMHFISHSGFIRDKIGMLVTQLSIRYSNSPIIYYPGHGRKYSAPQPGERAPDVMTKSSRLYDYFRHPRHSLLLFTGLQIDETKLAKAKERLQEIKQSYFESIQCYIVTPQPLDYPLEFTIIESSYLIHTRYCVQVVSTCIVRPDLYIAFFIKGFDDSLLNRFLHLYLRRSSYAKK